MNSARPEPIASPSIELREIGRDDLEQANAIVDAAVETWDIAPRVRRLVLPTYRYKPEDLDHLELLGARLDGTLVGLIALEPAAADDHAKLTLVHGLFVTPAMHGRGVGAALIDAGKRLAVARGDTGLLVRAERNARGFFMKRGFKPLPVADERRDYPHRLLLEFGDA
jgi:GNAT superfamily N-acetyltransferase